LSRSTQESGLSQKDKEEEIKRKREEKRREEKRIGK
jgi:hypothetical protein